MDEQTLFEPLSRRELEILALVCEGLTDREIAKRIFLALPTVKWYNRQSFSKLDVKNRREAVKRAMSLGLLAQNGATESAPPKHNLPSQLTPFVGRSRELAEIEDLLANPHTRLLTIMAPGGMGKTRLALEAAERSLSRFADGVFFAPLAALTSTDHIIPALAEALGLQFAPDGRTPEQQLTDFLRRKHLLLVIDNFEHLGEAAPLISDLLTAAPKVTALVTSRERLNLNGETVYPLVGLDYPETDADDPLLYGAAELFIECAMRANARFVVHDAATAIGRLCRRVQGMPLAIEMAAAAAGAMSVEEIDAEIARSADFLSTTMFNVPERQRSVRAVFEAAWGRLDEDARRVFRRMSVFRGGCTREAAQAVTGASIRTLAALVDKTLLWRDPRTGRYDVHELLRQYAEAELECAGETETTKQAHQEYYAALSAKWGAAMMLDQVEAGLAVFDADIDNVQSAFARASERAIPAEVEPFIDSWLYYDIRGKWREMIAGVERIIERLEPVGSITLAKFLCVHSDFLCRIRIFPDGYDYAKRAVDMTRQLGDHSDLSVAMTTWGNERSVMGGDLLGASDLYHEALGIARKSGHPMTVGVLLHQLARINYHLGKTEEALAYITEAYQWAKRHRLVWCNSVFPITLADLLLAAGRIDAAEPYYMEGLEIAHRLCFPLMLMASTRGLSHIAKARDDSATRQHHNKTIVQIQQKYGLPDNFLFESHVAVADTALTLGTINEACNYLRNAMLYLHESSSEITFKYGLVVTSNHLLQLGDHTQACALLSYGTRLPDPISAKNTSDVPADELLTQCRAALSPEEFEAAWARGQTMTNEEAIALVAEAL